MRTPEEIVAKCQDKDDWLGFTAQALAPFLAFEQAKPLLKEDASPDNWCAPKPLTREAVLADMREYMTFAWDKAWNHRGISAGRSVTKMEAWIWLLGDDAVLKGVESTSYENYGAPKLALICQTYGFPVPDEEGIRNMIAGKPCCPDCDQGCGK